MPGGLKPWLNAIGIFAATSFVVFYFDLTPLWYSAGLLAWIVRRRFVYHVRDLANGKAPDGADEGAGLLLASPRAVHGSDGARADPDAG
jgi:hypothetical protein